MTNFLEELGIILLAILMLPILAIQYLLTIILQILNQPLKLFFFLAAAHFESRGDKEAADSLREWSKDK